MEPDELQRLVTELGIHKTGAIYTLFKDGYYLWFLNEGKLAPYHEWDTLIPYGTTARLGLQQILGPRVDTLGIIPGEHSILEMLANMGEFEPPLPESKTYRIYGREFYFFIDSFK